jgi:hypothetical protein
MTFPQLPSLGTGDGGAKSPTVWTSADRQNLIVILILGAIAFALLGAILIVQQEGVRTNCVVMASAVIGVLGGTLRGTGNQQPQHNTQGVETGNVEQVNVQPQGTGQP